MIRNTRGNLLKSNAEALVNTVNTVGVMGKGVALQFKKAFPTNFKAYEKACKNHEVRPGAMFITETGLLQGPRFIVNFPTKRHWKGQSRIEDIESGLKALVSDIKRLNIRSVAIPPLGCGLGGLPWIEVKRLVLAAFSVLPEVEVELYEPTGAPDAGDMPNKTKNPGMTPGRAAFLGVLGRYVKMLFEPKVTLIEAQKLSYFLQIAGEPLRLDFVKWHYGPYADNLRHVLSQLEGHYVIGWGEGSNKSLTPLQILPAATREAEAYLIGHPDTLSRFEKVTELAEGFESAYGMELLATVHWVVVNELASAPHDTESILTAIQAWNERKSRLFLAPHVDAAMRQLTTLGWL